MQNVIRFLGRLFGSSSPLAKAAKAIVAGALPLLIVGLEQGALNWKAILAGGLTGLVTFLVPNKNLAAARPVA